MSFICPKCHTLNIGAAFRPAGCECCGFNGHILVTGGSTMPVHPIDYASNDGLTYYLRYIVQKEKEKEE